MATVLSLSEWVQLESLVKLGGRLRHSEDTKGLLGKVFWQASIYVSTQSSNPSAYLEVNLTLPVRLWTKCLI